MTDIQNLYHRFQQAQKARSGWETHWQECYEYALPQRESVFNPTHTPIGHLFDGTAPDSVDQLAALILSEMTPPWMRWFHLTAGTDLSDEESIRIAPTLDTISDTIQTHFDRSNFALEIHQCYLDLITAGTACLLFEEAPIGSASAFRFTAIPLSEVYLAEGPTGRLDTTFRQSQMDYDTFVNRFPEVKLLKNSGQKSEDEELTFHVIEAVIPSRTGGYQYTAFLDPASQHDSIDGTEQVLKEAFFETSPFISFRWLKAPGEVYGRSPVMKALPDIKTANKVVELILKNATIAVTGIWLAEDDGVLNPSNIHLTPGAIIPKAMGSKGLTPLEAPGKFDVSQLMIDDLRRKGVDEEVIAALELLTHDKETDYFEYVYKIAHSGNYTAIHTKINDLKHNFDRGRKSYKRAKELSDTEKAERLKGINEKHRKALQIFGYIPLYNSLGSIDF